MGRAQRACPASGLRQVRGQDELARQRIEAALTLTAATEEPDVAGEQDATEEPDAPETSSRIPHELP